MEWIAANYQDYRMNHMLSLVLMLMVEEEDQHVELSARVKEIYGTAHKDGNEPDIVATRRTRAPKSSSIRFVANIIHRRLLGHSHRTTLTYTLLLVPFELLENGLEGLGRPRFDPHVNLVTQQCPHGIDFNSVPARQGRGVDVPKEGTGANGQAHIVIFSGTTENARKHERAHGFAQLFFVGLHNLVVQEFVKQDHVGAKGTSAFRTHWRKFAVFFKFRIGFDLQRGLTVPRRAPQLVHLTVQAQEIGLTGASVQTIHILGHDCHRTRLDVILHLGHEAVRLAGLRSPARRFNLQKILPREIGTRPIGGSTEAFLNGHAVVLGGLVVVVQSGYSTIRGKSRFGRDSGTRHHQYRLGLGDVMGGLAHGVRKLPAARGGGRRRRRRGERCSKRATRREQAQ